jgi:hypothetical protein
MHALAENVGNTFHEGVMEKLLVSAICLMTGIVLTALSHRPARGLATVVDVTHHDIAAWIFF